MKNVSLCNDQCEHPYVVKNFNVAIFSDAIDIINVKLCKIVVHIVLHPFIPLSVTLIVFQKFCLLSSSSRSQWRLVWSKYDSFYCIAWTTDSLATIFGLMVHHRNPSILWKEAVKKKKKGLLHSKSKSQQRLKMSMNACLDNMCSKLPNILLPNLVWWCIIES